MLEIKDLPSLCELESDKTLESIDESTMDDKTLIGFGQYSFVYRIQIAGCNYVFKKFVRMNFENRLSEIYSCLSLKHQHIIGFTGIVKENENISGIILEFADQGTLYNRVFNDPLELPYETIVTYSRQIVMGLDFMHSQGISHQDIKLQNMFLHHGEIKIGDFGSAMHVSGYDPKSDIPYVVKSSRVPVATPLYSPLESLINNEIGSAGDMYSFGVILYEIVTSKEAWKPIEKFWVMLDEKENGSLPGSLPIDIPLVIEDVIKQCLVKNPSERLTAKKVLNVLPDPLVDSSEIFIPKNKWRAPSPEKQLIFSTINSFFNSRNQVEHEDLFPSEITLLMDILKFESPPNKLLEPMRQTVKKIIDDILEIYNELSCYVKRWEEELLKYNMMPEEKKWEQSDLTLADIMKHANSMPGYFTKNTVLGFCLILVKVLDLIRHDKIHHVESETELQLLNSEILMNQKMGSHVLRNFMTRGARLTDRHEGLKNFFQILNQGMYLLLTSDDRPKKILPSYHSKTNEDVLVAATLIAENLFKITQTGLANLYNIKKDNSSHHPIS